MGIEILMGLTLLIVWTLFSTWRYFSLAKKNREVFYSNILPLFESVRLHRNNIIYPNLSGYFKGHKISIIPNINSLSFRRLPKLYLKIYIAIENDCKVFSIRREDFDKHFPGDLFSARTLEGLKNCEEILCEKNFIKVTLPIASAEISHYRVTRAAIFQQITLETDEICGILSGILTFREELTSYARKKEENTCLVNNSSSNDCTSCWACATG